MSMQPMQPMYSQPQRPKEGFPVWAIVLIAVGGVVFVVFGVVVALGVYGTRRYIGAAKTAEAKNTVGAISRSAAAAYEREVFTTGLDAKPQAPEHQLCGSATPVPSSILAVKGTKYRPSMSPGADFQSGSPTTGWVCLKFAMTMDMYYQYHYTKGGPWIAPTVDPGPNGFEAAAKGDLNGDGKTSTFSRIGRVGTSGELTVATSLYVENEFE